MGYIQTVPGLDLSGLGFPKVLPPVPFLGTALYASHLCGSEWDGEAAAGDDWSGNERNLSINGAAVADRALYGSSATAYPLTPFTVNDLVGGDASCTMLGVFRIPTGAPTTPLFNSGGTAPYLALQAVEAGNRIQGYVFGTDGNSTDVSLTYNTVVENRFAFMGCRWTATVVQPFYVNPTTGALVTATVSHSRGCAGAAQIKMLNAAAPNLAVGATAFYRGALTDEQLQAVYVAMKAVMDPVDNDI